MWIAPPDVPRIGAIALQADARPIGKELGDRFVHPAPTAHAGGQPRTGVLFLPALLAVTLALILGASLAGRGDRWRPARLTLGFEHPHLTEGAAQYPTFLTVEADLMPGRFIVVIGLIFPTSATHLARIVSVEAERVGLEGGWSGWVRFLHGVTNPHVRVGVGPTVCYSRIKQRHNIATSDQGFYGQKLINHCHSLPSKNKHETMPDHE